MKTQVAAFQQPLEPIAGSLALSAILAALPLLLLFVMLGVFRMKAYQAALISLVLSILLAILGWRMPVGQVLSATGLGAFYAVFPILWILINALWIYKLTVATPWFEVLGRTIRSISDDLRILSILIAFCFGALLESLAGFGAPVAIASAMLMAAGMKPLKSAVVALLANTAPVAFGAMAAPIIALNGVTGIPLQELSSMTGRQTPFIALVVPLILVFLVDGKRGVRQTWPVALVAGAAFGLSQFVASNFFIVELTDVVAAVVTVVAVLLMLRVWQPVEIIGMTGETREAEEAGERVAETAGADTLTGPGRSDPLAAGATGAPGTGGATAVGDGGRVPKEDGGARGSGDTGASAGTGRPSGHDVWMAVAPYLVIIAVFSLAQVPGIKTWLTSIGSTTFSWPGLDVTGSNGKPVAAQTLRFDHIRATGTLLLFSGIITMILYRITPRRGVRVYGETLVQLRWTILTVCAVLALSFVMNLSGQTTTLGVALASAGGFFAILSPLLGWIGVALTGSDTSSNSLFGALQVAAANETGLSPTLMAAANSSAGVMGKMLSLQNLAIAAAAVGLNGAESTLLRKLIGWSLGLLAFLTLLIWLQSTSILGWMVP
ncbi:L-lactate permease [Arthrobacter sp. zg-Y40]|uniref:L-lactate permease n=1 Tax=unclassified Arthrobacter TaxID=235627 RepID=UPI001D14A237|nr:MULTISPECIES: L-lactate permease [unclassified Arthrobacter]MCC3275447.1 L-lactate permease [Arthrobacter sp. zg-Y20]MCC3278516.1 L-lactate permease [Arthrobacter sp. zg-Y40]MDK1315604.1 L-lactate permease [Arthrobacter sp. zg.Y20]WIB06018.1 L-lactate permease [Arthrobacter sp. zg-Y20]